MPEWNRPGKGVLGGLAGLVGLSAVAGILITTAVTPAIAVTGAATSNAITLFDNLPTSLDITPPMQPTTLYAKNPDTGEYQELTKFFDQNRTIVTYDQIAPVMFDAILSSEDPRFYQHGGIDMLGTGRAILSNLKGGGDTQGGSSISQQYVKNVLVQQCYAKVGETTYKDDADGKKKDQALQDCYNGATSSTGGTGIARKLQEMRYAIALEQKYSKKDILLGYLNIANFGGQTYGIEAAAEHYFGVHAKDLNVSQAATLAGMVKNPNTYRIDKEGGTYKDQKGVAHNSKADGYADTKVREHYVLDRMQHDGKITTAQWDEAKKAPITPNITPSTNGCTAPQVGSAGYFCEYVVSVIRNNPAFGADDTARKAALQQGGLKIYTTLDWRLQNVAKDSLTKYTPAVAPASANPWTFGAAITNIENSTGRVLSMAQNTTFTNDSTPEPGYKSVNYSADEKYGGSTGFAPGSTFKLFTLLDWLQQGHSLLDSVNGTNRRIPMVKNSCPGQGNWALGNDPMPGNYNREPGKVSTPLWFTQDSLNTGFYAMAEKLDLCDIVNEAAALGVQNANGTTITKSPDGKRPTVLNSVIGNTQAVSPLTLGNAYAAVANGGVQCQPIVIDKVTDSQGNEKPAPKADCKQVLDPNVAATAAYALQAVMKAGTGVSGNPNDGTQVMGKTGTNEANQSWLIQSSTAVTTSFWSGVVDGETFGANNTPNPAANIMKLRSPNASGYVWGNRGPISRPVQQAADKYYPAAKFPAPAANLMTPTMADLPNVVGMTQDQATQALQDAGFDVQVGAPVPSNLPTNQVAAQSPGAGKAASGSTVTISLSNGTPAATIPGDIIGKKLSDAQNELQQAGFNNINAQCTPLPGAKNLVMSSNPPPGSTADPSQPVTLTYVSDKCGGGGGGGNG